MAPIIYNTSEWLTENSKYFVPPICNKLMYGDGQLKTFFVGGPNSRKDFHMEEGEELFYQLKGEMELIVMEKGEFRTITIHEGEVFLLPSRIPHSPQRFCDTIGLVIERERLKSEHDCLRYYVKNSDEILYEKWFYCESLEELGPLIKEYFSSEAHRTGKPIPGSVLEDKPIKQDFQRTLDEPVPLKYWLDVNKRDLDQLGRKPLFKECYVSRINVLGKGTHYSDEDLPETFLMQLDGCSKLTVDGKEYEISKDQTALIPSRERYTLRSEESSRTLCVVMNPLKN